MNYECIKGFTGKNKLHYSHGTRISNTEYQTLLPEEQKNFIALVGESFAEQISDIIQRESHLENE